MNIYGVDTENMTEEELALFNEMVSFAKAVKNKNAVTTDYLINTSTVKTYGDYDSDTVTEMLADPRSYETQLRELARYLFNTSRMFKTVAGYLPSIAMYCPVVIPTRVGDLKGNTMLVQYEKATKYLTKLNLPHCMHQACATCCIEDVFYGLEYENDQTYYIKQLNPEYCRISSVEYGCYNFQFDLTFFDKSASNEVDTTLLEQYDLFIKGFFTKAYNAYKKTSDSKLRWVEIPAQNSVCFKWHEELDYTFPPYASIYPDIADIEDYKALSKTSEEQNNYKIIGFKIPRFNNTANDYRPDNFALKMSTANLFYQMTRDSIADSVGIFYTPMDFESISFSNSQTSSRNKVAEATEQLFDGLGFSQLLFNSDNATTLKLSIKIDEGQLFKFYRQIEQWVNRKMIYNFKGNWRCQLIDATVFSKEELIDQYLKLATYGVPVVPFLCAVVGMNQVDIQALNYIQNDILQISSTFLPLMSSNVQSGDGEEDANGNGSGRPEAKSTDSESTVVNKNNDTNEAK